MKKIKQMAWSSLVNSTRHVNVEHTDLPGDLERTAELEEKLNGPGIVPDLCDCWTHRFAKRSGENSWRRKTERVWLIVPGIWGLNTQIYQETWREQLKKKNWTGLVNSTRLCSFLLIGDQVITTNIRASMNSFSSAHLYLHWLNLMYIFQVGGLYRTQPWTENTINQSRVN